jgi:hypothetical protein
MAEHSGRFAITPARNVDDDRLLGAARPNDKAIDYDAEAGGAPASFGGHRYFSDSASRPETEAAESASLPPARYDAMCRAIDAAYEVDEVKDIRDKAIALETYSKQARNKEAERRAREIRLRAERKAGKLLRAMKKAKGAAQPGIGRAGGTRSDGPTALRDLGISKEQSSNWQKLADVPEDEFEAALVDPTQTPSTIGIIRSAEEQNQLPRVSVAADALWLWARLLDFERHGLIGREPSDVLLTMTQEMLDDIHTLAPRVATWLQRIGRPLTPPEVETQKGKPLPADGGETSGRLEACTPREIAEVPHAHPEIGSVNQPPPAPLKEFRVQISKAVITALVFRHHEIRHSQQDDLIAIITALARLGHKPKISETPEHVKVLSF